MYAVKYHKMIEDGDSNVYKSILDAWPYNNIVVEKNRMQKSLIKKYVLEIKRSG